MSKKTTVVKMPEPKTFRMVRALRLELAKPIGTTWDELGDMLRDRRAVMHRLLNAGTALLWSRRYDGHHEGETVRALEAIKAELASYQEWCRAQAKKTKDPNEEIVAEMEADALAAMLKSAASRDVLMGPTAMPRRWRIVTTPEVTPTDDGKNDATPGDGD